MNIKDIIKNFEKNVSKSDKDLSFIAIITDGIKTNAAVNGSGDTLINMLVGTMENNDKFSNLILTASKIFIMQQNLNNEGSESEEIDEE